jgi:hypothetical protein
MDLFKDILKSLMVTKVDLSEDPDFEKTYDPFIVNKALGFYPDCIHYAQAMNERSHLDKKTQYLFFLNSLRAWKRPYRPWVKKAGFDDLKTITEYYKCSHSKANEIRTVLTDAQIDILKGRLHKGGVVKNE